jgi:hypothetical protein
MIESDLRSLIRYEIPGLITVFYILLFSHPIFLEGIKNYSFNDLAEYLSEFSVAIVVIGLPLGYLVHSVYTNFDYYDKFLSKRHGYKVVLKILEKKDKKGELIEYWEGLSCEKQNEVLDIIFYKKEKELANILERYIGYFHSNYTISKWAPIVAFILSIIIYSLYFIILDNNCQYSLILIHSFFNKSCYEIFRILFSIFVENLIFIICRWYYIIIWMFSVLIPIYIYHEILSQKGKNSSIRKIINQLEENILLENEIKIFFLVDRKYQYKENKDSNK